MVHYRRNKMPEGCYFFTVTLQDRCSKLLIEHVDLLRQALRKVQNKKPYKIIAAAIMPDHLHSIWQLPENDMDCSGRWRDIKCYFTQALKRKGICISFHSYVRRGILSIEWGTEQKPTPGKFGE